LAEQDGDALLPFFAEDRRVKAVGGQQRDRLVEELGKLRQRKEDAVVVHLRAHALGWDDKLFLLPANARLGDPTTWLDFEEVLALLQRCPAPHKLLILDLTHPIAGARVG